MTRLRLRIDFAAGAQLGPGKVGLLEAIAATGSISAAGRRLGMSYKRAWQLVDIMNQAFRAPVVAAQQGGPGGGGATLTALGQEVVRRYRCLEATALAAATDDVAALEALLAGPSPNVRPEPDRPAMADHPTSAARRDRSSRS